MKHYAEARGTREDQRAAQLAKRGMYSRSSCDGVPRVRSPLLGTVGSTYRIISRLQQQLRELRVLVCSLQHRTEQNVRYLVCTAAAVVVAAAIYGATHELSTLLLGSRSVPRTVSTTAYGARLVRSNLLTQLRCGLSYVSVLRFPLIYGFCNVRLV